MLPRGLAPLVVVAALATHAHAQQATDGLGIERMHIAMDRGGLLDVEWGEVPAHLAWGAGVAIGFAHAPLVVYDRDMQPVASLVDRRLTTTFAGSVGLAGRLEAGVAVDIIGYQSGTDSAPAMGSLPAGGLGDAHLLAKARIAGGHDAQLALAGALSIPMGGARGYLRDPGVSFAPALVASARTGRFRGAINAGYALKPRVSSPGLVSDDEAFVRVGAGVALDERAQTELWWSTSLAAPLKNRDKNEVAIEMLVGARRDVSRTVGAFVAGGLGLDNGYGVPDWRVVTGLRYELSPAEVVKPRPPPPPPPPADPDADHDGVQAAADLCPTKAEDVDGFKDDDGCPDDPATLVGRVVDPDGRPLANAHVTVAQLERPGSAPLELDADEGGAFTTTLDGGALHVTATVAEYKTGTLDTVAPPGTKSEISVKLVRAVRQGQLRGQVLAFNGKPIAGATIAVTGANGSGSAQTDADGTFTVELPAGAFAVEISAAGFATQKRSVSIKLDGVTVLNVDLRGSK